MLIPSAEVDLMVTKRPENGPRYHHLLRQTSWWQKDWKMVHANTICWGRPHGDKKTRKWSTLSPYAKADLMVTKRPENGQYYHHLLRQTSWWQRRPENGLCYHHLLRQTSWWQKDQKNVHAIIICWGRPHGDRKDQKNVHAITIC